MGHGGNIYNTSINIKSNPYCGYMCGIPPMIGGFTRSCIFMPPPPIYMSPGAAMGFALGNLSGAILYSIFSKSF